MNSFEISSIIYDANLKKLTFNLSEDAQRICIGIETLEQATEEIMNIIKQISA